VLRSSRFRGVRADHGSLIVTDGGVWTPPDFSGPQGRLKTFPKRENTYISLAFRSMWVHGENREQTQCKRSAPDTDSRRPHP